MLTAERHPVLRASALVLGLVLVAAAVWLAVGRIDLDTLRRVRPWHLAVMAAAVSGNLLLSGALFWSVTRVFDARPPVGLWRMTELIAGSSLLNYLPLRPGLAGRAAYLKKFHALPLRQSVLSLAIVLAVSVLVAAAVAGAVVLGGPLGWSVLLLSIGVLSVLCPVAAEAALRRPIPGGWAWAPLRCADVCLAGLRLWVAMRVVDAPVTLYESLALAAAGTLVSLTGLTPNGLGLREWAVAVLAGLLSPGALAAAGLAAVIDRAVEAAVVAVAGLGALHRLHRGDGGQGGASCHTRSPADVPAAPTLGHEDNSGAGRVDR